MLEQLRGLFVRKVFGDGIQGMMADKGIDWLRDEFAKARNAEPEFLDEVRLRPGDSYTIIARPPATRRERKLASRVEQLRADEEKLARTRRSQRRSARALAKMQRRLDRRRPGTARYRRAKRNEARAAARFDAVMKPSQKLVKVRRDLASATKELQTLRGQSFLAARAGRPVDDATTVFH